MKTDERQTFEDAYRDTVRESAIYELKSNRPYAGWQESHEAAQFDCENIHLLMDNLLHDMSSILGRRIIRSTQMSYRPMRTRGINFPELLFADYSQRMPAMVQKIINGLVSHGTHTLYNGWIRWSGWDATTTMTETVHGRMYLKTIKFTEAEEISVENAGPLPAHIQATLKKLKKTKFNYQPYIFTGSNGEKVLAIRLGCLWHDMAIARWTDTNKSATALQGVILLMLVAILGFITSVSLLFNVEGWVYTFFTIVGALVSGLGTGFMALLVADHFRPIRV